MRQFVFGVLVAAFAWWGYGKWTQSEVMAQPASNRVTANKPARGSMSELLGAAAPGANAATRGPRSFKLRSDAGALVQATIRVQLRGRSQSAA